jgi:hypothetical protein
MIPSRRTLILHAAAAISMGTSLPLAAQTATFASLTESDRTSILAAEKLEAEARDLSAGPGWASAARLYRNAAELRGAGDFTAADNLRLAGYIGFYEGRLATSVVVLTRAADAFLAGGDVLSAASTLADAAWVAVQAGDGLEAQTLRDRALLLTRSPLLDAANREMLVRRLGT